MSGIASYLMTVTAAAILTAILLSISGRGPMGNLVKFLSGIFMAVTMVSPVLKVEMPYLDKWLADCSVDGQMAAAWGEEMANETRQTIIKGELDAYILDKAKALGSELAVDVDIDDDGIPVGVALTGEISPDARRQLTQIIESDLGLGEEAQRWSS